MQSWDAVTTAEAVRSGRVSATEVVAAALDRTQRRNPRLNAVIDVYTEHALEQAKRPNMGLLAGVPLLLKDTDDYPGFRYADGSRLHLNRIGSELPAWVAAMKAEGAVIVGKTSVPEFGLSDVTEPVAFGPTLNPWRDDIACGGSSGGAVAAVAAGMVPVADGSDGGGSIRSPAHNCGLFGFKPGRGRTTSALPTFDPRLQAGVVRHALTRSVRDSALLFAIAEAHRLGQPGQAAQRVVREPLNRKLTVAVISRPLHGGTIDAEHAAALHESAELLAKLGHRIVAADWPFDAPALHSTFFDRFALGMWSGVRFLPADERQLWMAGVEGWTSGLVQRAAALSPEQVDAVVVRHVEATAAMQDFFKDVDVLLTPVSARFGIPVGFHGGGLSYETLLPRIADNVAFTQVQNICGQPAMSVPLFTTAQGLPVGTHLSAAQGADELLFALALQLERARPWADRWPPGMTAT